MDGTGQKVRSHILVRRVRHRHSMPQHNDLRRFMSDPGHFRDLTR